MRCLILVLLAIGSQSGRLTGQTRIEIPSETSCGECRVYLRRIATLGRPGDPVSVMRISQVARDRAGRFYVAPIYNPGQIAVYDGRGRFVRTAGRSGQGPGEFGWIDRIRISPADNVHVYENNRETVLTPGMDSVVAVRNLPVAPYDVAFLDDGRTVLHYPILGRGRSSEPLHVLTPDAEIGLSFGGDGRAVDPQERFETMRSIAPARDGGVWSARINRYRIDRWSVDGSRSLTVVRDATWFRPWRGIVGESTLRQPPRPSVSGVVEDRQGLLWVAIAVADAEWQPSERQGDVPLTELNPAALYDTIIEVLDLRRGRVLTRARIDGASRVRMVGDDLLLHTTREDEDGNVLIDVWRVELRNPDSRRVQ